MEYAVNHPRYQSLFDVYDHNLAVIYSSLEGQYAGRLMVDSTDAPRLAILLTPFAFHFVAGDPDAPDVVDRLDEMIFKTFLAETKEKEAVVFSPSAKWDQRLDDVFSRHQGLKDQRKIFQLDEDKFRAVCKNQIALPDVRRQLMYEQANGSSKAYPVSRIYSGEQYASFCSAFMLGKNHAEIDVGTEPEFRGRGYAKAASIDLITELLHLKLTPDWCTWPYRKESEHLALSLGFSLLRTVPAHIWVEDVCGPLE